MSGDVSRLQVPSLPNAKTQRKVPKPFARPSIQIGAGIPPSERREWTIVPSQDIRVGDIVPGIGRVFSVNEQLDAPRYKSGLTAEQIVEKVAWTVTVSGGAQNVRVFQGGEEVWCYTVTRKVAE